MEEEAPCTACGLRKKFDDDPQSFLGRLWRWHIKWCPGWKKYLASLPDDERESVCQKYNIR